MNIDQISPSILHVTAKENLNIEHDLNQNQSNKTISELINEEENKNEENTQG
jgi:hypothetical protein